MILSFSLSDAADLATVIGGAAAFAVLITACLAYGEYRRNVRTQRAQWLLTLYERFYETDRYRDARRSGYNVSDKEKWADYLNFFEFVAYLQRGGNLTRADVEAMFDYWLNELNLEEIREQLPGASFENLEAYLASRERTG